jgi:excisionase family DNA binding protein
MAPSPPTGQPTDTDGTPEFELSLLTVEEAARRLSIGRTTMYALLKDSQINSVRIGRVRRISVEALTAYTTRLIVKQHTA